ncbi:unnamed protein product [marine sediment metagenome]|uniref:Uncharacterized protein n=1 Tax=marine sediment metagenome TaxID=412755 RepID=X1B1X7_9ZZZZ
MNKYQEAYIRSLEFETRRHFLKKCTSGLGAIALASLSGCKDDTLKTINKIGNLDNPLRPKAPTFLFVSGLLLRLS